MKKVPFLFPAILFLFTALLLTHCTRGSMKTTAFVSPPFKTFSLPTEKIAVDAVKGGVVKMTNGTTIEVPAMAFVDAQGKPIETPVTIVYEHYESTAEVIASGIPMNYDSAGTIINFETAGMFKLNATTANNADVQIAPGKTLQVNMASNVEGNQFNFYSFDEEKGNWVYEGRTDSKPNSAKQELLKTIPECEEPATPQAARKNSPVFDLSVDYNLYPELKAFQQTLWQCAPGCSEQEVKATVETLQQNFDNLKLEVADAEQGLFKLTLYNKEGKISVNICPVVKETDLAAAKELYAQKFKSYQKAVTEKQQIEATANLQSNLYRSFAVAEFGIYNWDCQYKRPGVMNCKVNCNFDQDVNAESLCYYLLCGQEKKAVCYNYADLQKYFAFDPNKRNKLICVVNGSQIGVVDINGSDANTYGRIIKKREIDCYFKTIPMTINSVADLDQLVKSL